MTELKAYDVF